ncbi:MAG: hypothetical protein DRJ44_05330 [Thermoprotei archaeon]|nr:MAG: hypothetical protein DRJ44_05330 [Thermoprotei archaeon]
MINYYVEVFRAKNICSVYPQVLEFVLTRGVAYSLIVDLAKPAILKEDVVDEELSIIGVDLDLELHEKYKNFIFGDGKSGSDKIKKRLQLFRKGKYALAISSFGQLNFIMRALPVVNKKTWLYNRLICLAINPRHKKISHIHFSNKPVPPCLVMLDFKLRGKYLDLISVWRLDYIDTRAYGNWIALAMLLREICLKTRYEPGHLTIIANKALIQDKSSTKFLLERLKSMPLID